MFGPERCRVEMVIELLKKFEKDEKKNKHLNVAANRIGRRITRIDSILAAEITKMTRR